MAFTPFLSTHEFAKGQTYIFDVILQDVKTRNSPKLALALPESCTARTYSSILVLSIAEWKNNAMTTEFKNLDFRKISPNPQQY